MGTVDINKTTKEELSELMVGRKVNFAVEKPEQLAQETVLRVDNLVVASKRHNNNAVKNVSLEVRRGEIVAIAGIEGNGQTEFVYGLTGIEPIKSGSIHIGDKDISKYSIRRRSLAGISHIPEDRHKYGLVLDFSLADNLVLQKYFEPRFQKAGFIKKNEVTSYAEGLIERFDVRSGQGAVTRARSMSGGNQQKAIVAREIDRNCDLLIAVQPTRGLDVGAIEYIHKQLVDQRNDNKAVLLVSLEIDEVMSLADRILVMYEGEIVGELDPKTTTVQQLGLYMAGAKRDREVAASE
jgi:simple sugar transport system ATP-binding protein